MISKKQALGKITRFIGQLDDLRKELDELDMYEEDIWSVIDYVDEAIEALQRAQNTCEEV